MTTTLLNKYLNEGTREFTYGQAQKIILDYTKHLLREDDLLDMQIEFRPTQLLIAVTSKNRIFLNSEYLDKNFLENNGHIDVDCILDMICAGSHARTHLNLNREFKRKTFDYDKTSLMKETMCVLLAPMDTFATYLNNSNTEIIARKNKLKTRREIESRHNLPAHQQSEISGFNEADVEITLRGREFIGKSSDVSHAALNFLMLFGDKDPDIKADMIERYPNLAFEFRKDGVRHTYREVLKIKEQQLTEHPTQSGEIESYFHQMITSDPLLHAQFISSISAGSTASIRDIMTSPTYIEDRNITNVLDQEAVHLGKEFSRLLHLYKKSNIASEKTQILLEAGELRKQISDLTRTMNLVITRRESSDSLKNNIEMLLKLSSFKNQFRGKFKKLIDFGQLENLTITTDLRGEHNYPLEQIRIGPNPYYQPKPFGLR